jgi:hypothetical protein
MTRVIALMALAALGLPDTAAPVHDYHSERLTSTAERHQTPREIRRSGWFETRARADRPEHRIGLSVALLPLLASAVRQDRFWLLRDVRYGPLPSRGALPADYPGRACPGKPVSVWIGVCNLPCCGSIVRLP